MPSLEATLDPADDSSTEALVPVGDFASVEAAAERGLVVLAMGLPYWLVPADDHFVLQVEAAAAPDVCDQLARYERECAHWPPAPLAPPSAAPRAPYFTPLLWALGLIVSFWAQFRWPSWLPTGALEPDSIFRHDQWWRPFTALFLHADVGHLIANTVAGVFIFAQVLGAFGRRTGWLLLGSAAFAANTVSAALPHPIPYVAIGASTAVFAGLGLLTGRAIGRTGAPSGAPPRWQPVLMPLSAGLVLFALWGTGGPRVDFGAHVCGFVAGLIAGTVTGAFGRSDSNANPAPS